MSVTGARRAARHPTAGVSLLEVLVALAVMAFLAVIASSLLTFSGRTLERVSAKSEIAEVALGRNELRSWLERAVMDTEDGVIAQSVTGTANSLTFVAILNDGQFWPAALTEVTLSSPDAVDNASLAATATGIAEVGHQPTSRTLRLSQGTARLEIRYFGATIASPIAQWRDSWQAAEGLPDLVELTISDMGMRYPPLIIRPGKEFSQREISLSSLLPPARPSRP